nr:RNA-binding protein with multiple splicing 2 [Ipomoea batatas]
MPLNDPNRPPNDEVRTIFISGLPEDVKERELQNLLRWLPGYEASQVNFKGEHPMGFALFSTPQFAIAAKDALQAITGIVADSNAYDQSKRMRTGGDYTHTGYSSPSPFHPPPAPAWGPPAQPGYKQMKVLRQERHTVCFIEFEMFLHGRPWFSLTSGYIFKESIWKKEGFQSHFPCCKWSSTTYDLPVAGRGCILFSML